MEPPYGPERILCTRDFTMKRGLHLREGGILMRPGCFPARRRRVEEAVSRGPGRSAIFCKLVGYGCDKRLQR